LDIQLSEIAPEKIGITFKKARELTKRQSQIGVSNS